MDLIKPYLQLMRVDRPIGIYLVLWPTLCALWVASEGPPPWQTLIIFVLGGFLMRSAGCVINDYADKDIDGAVARTKDRPLIKGTVSPRDALVLFVVLVLLAFLLVLMTNGYTVSLSLVALLFAGSYPFMKRYTYLPQVVLGAAFAWSVPMAFAATQNALPPSLWLFYIAVLLWTVTYDTFYGMVDREDDMKIGVKSTAILFGDMDRFMTSLLQVLAIITLILFGIEQQLGWVYVLTLIVCSGLFVYQQYLIRERKRDACFKAFINNHWVGMVLFVGIVLDYSV